MKGASSRTVHSSAIPRAGAGLQLSVFSGALKERPPLNRRRTPSYPRRSSSNKVMMNILLVFPIYLGFNSGIMEMARQHSSETKLELPISSSMEPEAEEASTMSSLPPPHRQRSYFTKSEGFSFWCSFLYWRPRQSFMDIALKSKQCCELVCPNSAGGASWGHAKRIEINPDYQPGYKIGFEVAHGNWGLFADGTYFDFDDTRSVSSSEEGFLFARWIQPGVVINNSSSHIKAKWSTRMEVVNVEAGRKCYFGRRLMLKPHFGIAAAWIDQRFKGRFLLNMPVNELKMRHESDSWGVGPRVGVDMDLRIFRGFGLVGTAATDLLYTHYDLDLKARSPNNPTLFSGISSDLNVLRAELDFYLCINTCCKVSRKTFLELQLGYDFQIWCNQK